MITEVKGLLKSVSFYIRTILHLVISSTIAYYLSRGLHANYVVMLSAILVIQLAVLIDMLIKTAKLRVTNALFQSEGLKVELVNVSTSVILLKILWEASIFCIVVILFIKILKDSTTQATIIVTLATLISTLIDIIKYSRDRKEIKNS